jgi:hypothetical protein
VSGYRLLAGVLSLAAVVANASAAYTLSTPQADANHWNPEVCVDDLKGWDLCYTTSNGDGLIVRLADYEEQLVFTTLRIPHVWVQYSGYDPQNDNFAHGLRHTCSLDSSYSDRFILSCTYYFDDADGLWSPTNWGTYKYVEQFTFFTSGVFRPRLLIYGPGFDYDHAYRALFRMDFDILDSSDDLFAQWQSGAWSHKGTEGYYKDDYYNSNGYKSGYEWTNSDNPGSPYYAINPQSADGVNGTNGAPFWATRYHAAETEGSQGYAWVYLDSEDIWVEDIVDWYTAVRYNDACYSPASPHNAGPETIAPAGY